MDLGHLIDELNWLDWAVLLLLVTFTIGGIRRGLILGVVDLVGVAVSLAAALSFYPAAADRLAGWVSIPRSLLAIAACLALFALAQWLYAFLISALARLTWGMWLAFRDLSWMNRLMGAVPGAVKGVVFTTLLLLPFGVFPLVPSVSASIERSVIAGRLVNAAIEQAPRAEALIGRDFADGLTYLAPPQTDDGQKITFGALGQLAPDPTVEERMLELVNIEREKAGLKPLVWDGALTDLGRAHGLEMFNEGYFAHNSPTNGTPFDRMRKAGIRFVTAGENLAYAPSVQVAHEGLMNSPGHRENILRPEFGKIGIGAIRSDFRGTMFSQEFTN